MIISDLVAAVANEFHMDAQDVIGTKRFKYIMRARFALYKVLHVRGMSLSNIGRVCGGRDHTTIIHGLKQADEWMRRDPIYKEIIERVSVLKAYRVQLRPETGAETHNHHIV